MCDEDGAARGGAAERRGHGGSLRPSGRSCPRTTCARAS